MNKTHQLPLIVAAITFALMACSPEASPSFEVTPVADATPTTLAAEISPSAEAGINSPIPAEDIATRLELVGVPSHVAASDSLRVAVRVHNDGRVPLVSRGSVMVNLGAMLIGPEGPDKAPGNRDFLRMSLPMVAPGQSAEISGELPVASLLDLPIRLELVQEGVNWFSAYGQPTIDIGPFRRCTQDSTSLCDADGKAVASE